MKENQKAIKPKVKVKIPDDIPTYSPSGFFGGLSESEGIIKLFEEDLIPKLDQKTDLILDIICKKFLLNIKIPPIVWKRMAYWMIKHIIEYEKKFGEIKIKGFKPKIKGTEIGYEFL